MKDLFKSRNFFRKSEAGLTVILVIVVVLFFLGWLINLSQRECKSNKDCGSESYCGSDFSCHAYPTIQKTIVQYSLLWPAVIIGISIIIAAWIFKNVEIRYKGEPKQEAQENENNAETAIPEEVEEINEPYYKNESNIKVP